MFPGTPDIAKRWARASVVHQDKPISGQNNTKEIFGLLAGVAIDSDPNNLRFFNQDGVPVTSSATGIYNMVKDLPNGVAFESQHFGDVCTMLGREETWVLENWTNEDHNFHIHQSRFLLDTSKPYSFPKSDIAALAQRGATTAELDRAKAQNLDRTFIERLFSAGSDYAASYHDNIPVPAGIGILSGSDCDGTPGNPNCRISPVTIKIRFDRKEQVGKFVYHCHILEHEDGGMMASVRVCDPSKAKGKPGADSACFSN
jgi:FtsP/CotA-like multicopper oxidase with cupredoxin domain